MSMAHAVRIGEGGTGKRFGVVAVQWPGVGYNSGLGLRGDWADYWVAVFDTPVVLGVLTWSLVFGTGDDTRTYNVKSDLAAQRGWRIVTYSIVR